MTWPKQPVNQIQQLMECCSGTGGERSEATMKAGLGRSRAVERRKWRTPAAGLLREWRHNQHYTYFRARDCSTSVQGQGKTPVKEQAERHQNIIGVEQHVSDLTMQSLK